LNRFIVEPSPGRSDSAIQRFNDSTVQPA